MITIQEILDLRSNIFINHKVKFVRHRDFEGIVSFKDLVNNRENILEYQKEQEKHIFNCDYIVSFLGLENLRSLLFGVFKVHNYTQKQDFIYYDLEEVDGFEDLNERVVIKWGHPNSARSWHQWYDNIKEVIEILPKGSVGPFPGHYDLFLEFNELEKIVAHQDANKDWIMRLSSINGIYLILDKSNGKQYIGSANSTDGGIFGRWENYVKTKHGGNDALIELQNKDSNHYLNFSFSILQTLPSNITKPEINRIENLYKRKLGTREFGLNKN